MPLMKATGTKTADEDERDRDDRPVTSFMAFKVASRGDEPCSMWCSTASTTTMASSTTRPMASTRPKSESVLTENPSSGNGAKAPMSETRDGEERMSVARQLWRKMKTTSTTSAMASTSVWMISSMPARDGRRRIERDLVFDARREALRELVHRLADGVGDVERVRAGRLEDGDDRGRLAVQRAVLLVRWRAELDAADVPHAHAASRRGSPG